MLFLVPLISKSFELALVSERHLCNLALRATNLQGTMAPANNDAGKYAP